MGKGLFPNRKNQGRKRGKLKPPSAKDVQKAAKTTSDVAEVVGTIAAFIPGVGGAVNLAAKAVEKGADAVGEQAGKLAGKHKKRRKKNAAKKELSMFEKAKLAGAQPGAWKASEHGHKAPSRAGRSSSSSSSSSMLLPALAAAAVVVVLVAKGR